MKNYLGYGDLEVDKVQGETGSERPEDEKQSLWKQLSQYMGKDVTSLVSLPVWIFEPLSFLQIMCEPMQYAELLLKASESKDQFNRMGYLLAFIASGYSCAVRNKKPFNPLLGETFEFEDKEHKWRFFAEQVSHHPPIGVAHVSHEGFVFRFEMGTSTKFRGNSIDVKVNGLNTLEFTKFNDVFTWGHMDTIAHNIIIGGMWVDHFGTLEIKNHTTGDRGVLKFTQCGWLGAGRFDMSAEIFDSTGKLRMKLFGKWNEVINAVKIKDDGTDSAPILLWKRSTKMPNNKWGWSPFCQTMCEFDGQYAAILPKSDSRLRGDRLWVERDNLEVAGKEKIRLEEQQRAQRKAREAAGEAYSPKYFKQVEDHLGAHFVYSGHYWEDREEKLRKLESGELVADMSALSLAPPTPTSTPSAEEVRRLEAEMDAEEINSN